MIEALPKGLSFIASLIRFSQSCAGWQFPTLIVHSLCYVFSSIQHLPFLDYILPFCSPYPFLLVFLSTLSKAARLFITTLTRHFLPVYSIRSVHATRAT